METKKTAQGNIYLLSSSVIILACGFIVNIFLARWLGLGLYGLYGLIMSILLWVEYTVMMGIPTTYRKVISEDDNMIDSVMHSIKRLFVPYCLVIMVIYFFASPLISQALNDRRLLPLLLIAGIDIPFYGIYYAFLGILNGSREFFRFSMVGIGYALFKTIFVIIFISLELGIVGALIANILASFFGLLVASFFVKRLEFHRIKRKVFDLKPRLVKFGTSYLSFTLTAMFLIHMDIWFVKGLLNDDAMTGFYSVSYNLTRPLFFLITGITVVVFPSFSKAVSEGKIQLLQKYIKQAMRLALAILFPITMMMISTSGELITFLFTSVYLPASKSFQILLLGISLFSVFSLFLNIIAAENKPFLSFFISLSLVPVAIVINYFLISSYGINGAAMATTVISGIGVIVSGTYLWRRFGAIVNFITLLRVIVASGCIYVISNYMVTTGYWLMLEYFLLSLIYLVILLLLGEINSGDLRIIKETCYPLSKRTQSSTTT